MSLSAATNGGCSCLRPSELTISGVAWRMPWISSEVLFKLAQQTMFDDFWDFWDFWRSKSCSNHEWWKLYTVEFHLYTFEKKMANNGHVSVTDPSPSSLNYNHLCNTTRSLFSRPLVGSFRGQCCYHTETHRDLGPQRCEIQRRGKISKTGGCCLAAPVQAGWWSEDLGLGGMTIETEPSWNRWYFNIFHSSAQWSSYPEIISNNM